MKLRPGITGSATLKYRLEDEMISKYVAKKQKEGHTREIQEIALEYSDTVIYPDKVVGQADGTPQGLRLKNYSAVKEKSCIFAAE